MRTSMAVAALAALALAGCKVQVNDHGKLPDVDVKKEADGTPEVNVQPGRMPDVDEQTDSVRVPNIQAPDIKTPHIEAPDIKAPDVNLPSVDVGNDRNDTTRRRAPR
ncbi:MAG TPA: hypothetical protein VF541_01920 [Longimicrobium sp.]